MNVWVRHKKIVIPIGIALIGLLINLLFEKTGLTDISRTYNQVRNRQYSVNFSYGILAYGIVAPIIEEIMFRLVCFRLLKKFISVIPAIIISALAFGIYHGNIVQGLYAFLMGILLAVGYHVTDDFKVPVASHALSNILVYAITMCL